jgi:hypothetical protein
LHQLKFFNSDDDLAHERSLLCYHIGAPRSRSGNKLCENCNSGFSRTGFSLSGFDFLQCDRI